MGDRAVTYLIDAEDFASEKFQEFYRTIDQGSKNILEMAGQFKQLAGQAIQVGESLGMMGLDRWADDIAGAADVTASYMIDMRELGEVSFETKAAMAQLAWTIGFEVGTAIGEALAQTQQWTFELQRQQKVAQDIANRVDKEINSKKTLNELERESANIKERAAALQEKTLSGGRVRSVGRMVGAESLGSVLQSGLDAVSGRVRQIQGEIQTLDAEAGKLTATMQPLLKEKIAAMVSERQGFPELTKQNAALVEQYRIQAALTGEKQLARDINRIMTSDASEAAKQQAIGFAREAQRKRDESEQQRADAKRARDEAKAKEKREKEREDAKRKAQQETLKMLEKERSVYDQMNLSITELIKGKEKAAQLKYEQQGFVPEAAKKFARIEQLQDEIQNLKQGQAQATDPNKFKDQRFGTGRAEADARRRDAETQKRLNEDRNAKLTELNALQTDIIRAIEINNTAVGRLGS